MKRMNLPEYGVSNRRVNEKLGRYDRWGKEASEVVELSQAGLFADVGEVAEVPGDEVIDLVD